MDKPSIRAVIGAGVILGGLGVVGLGTYFGDSRAQISEAREPVAAPQPRPQGEQAYYLARKVCQGMLKSPTSAKFSNPNLDAGTGWQPDGYFQWKVGGFVDAKNPLGVMLRDQWNAVVQFNTGRLEVVYLRVGDQVAGKLPPMRRAPGK